jgi:hypothetical protein
MDEAVLRIRLGYRWEIPLSGITCFPSSIEGMENLVLLVISTTMANWVHVVLVIALAGYSKENLV